MSQTHWSHPISLSHHLSKILSGLFPVPSYSCHPVITSSHQSPFASSQWWVNTSGQLGAISSWMWEASGSIFCLCTLHYSSTCCPDSCAPFSFNVSSDHQTFGLSGLLQTIGTAWVGHRRVSAAHCSSALPQALPPPSVGPAQPQPTGSLLPSQGVVAAVIGVLSLHWLFGCVVGFLHVIVVSVILMVPSVSTPPWLLPPAMPPWGECEAVSNVAWIIILPFVFSLHHLPLTFVVMDVNLCHSVQLCTPY